MNDLSARARLAVALDLGSRVAILEAVRALAPEAGVFKLGLLQTGKGEFGTAIALGLIVLPLAYMVNLGLTWVQQRGKLPE